MNLTVIAICAICLVAAIIIDNKFDVPIGLTCMLAAFTICYLAYGMPAAKVITSFFPSTIVMPLILAMTYFTVFSANGTSDIIAKKIIGMIHGNMKLYPWTLLGLCTLMYIFFDGAALRYVLAPLVFSVAMTGGGSTLMAISTAYLAFVVGSFNPYIGMDAVTRQGIFTDIGLENATNISLAIWIVSLILIFAAQLFVYVITKSWKVPNIDYKASEAAAEISRQQKRSFIILLTTVLLFIIPPLLKGIFPSPFTKTLSGLFSFYNVFLLGSLAIIIWGLDDWRNMLKRVSLRPIMMIIGVTLLIKTAQQAGLQELCTLAATSVPSWLVPPVLIVICAFLSFFVSAPTIQPMLFPMVAAMAKTPAQAITYLACACIGLAASGISPISSSGVAFLSTVDLQYHEEYSNKMFLMAFLLPAVFALLAATGLVGSIAGTFASWYY